MARRLVSWFVVGLIGSLIELGLLRLLVDDLAWAFPLATAVAAETLIVLKFLVADRWVFSHRWPTFGRLGRYHGASFGALVVYWLVANALGLLLGAPYVAAFIVGTGAAFTWSLFTNFLWVWRQPSLNGA